MELAGTASVPTPENIARPVESTADPMSTPLDGHEPSANTEPATTSDTSGSKATVETSAATSDNQRQEPASVCSTGDAHALTSNAETTKTQQALAATTPSLPDKQVTADTLTESASDVAASTSQAPKTPTENAAVADALLSGDSRIDELMAVTAPIAPLLSAASPSEHVTPPPNTIDKPAKKEKKPNDSFVPAETLALVQQFLADKVAHNQCSSHSKYILEFVDQHLNDKQRRHYVGTLVQRIVEQFAKEAQAKGEEVSVDVQTSICLVEQMFLTLGRASPLQDMYTQEEEEMLDLLFHGEDGSESEIASPD